MDVVLLSALALLLFIIIIVITWLSRKGTKKKSNNVREQAARGQPIQRTAGVRGVRQRRTQRPAAEQVQDQSLVDSNEEADDEGQTDEANIDLSKVGSKKRAKLEAKAEKKAQREIAERDREDRKRRQQLEQEERDRQSAREKEQERKREEAEKIAREEKEKREHEEYLKMKEAFNVEEEGYEEGEDDETKRDLLNEFIEYIKCNKVVILEDLAAHFGLKTASAIERVQQLQADGLLSGVIDDRGKFIYISQEELLSVAKFIKQRGRVSITELVEHSNSLINLNPEKKTIETN